MPPRKPTIGTPGGTVEKPAIFFADPDEFGAWLAANHDTATELWMGLRRRHVADRGLTWKDAVVEALRWGWIDSRAERIDDDTRRQRWTPRKPGSIWSAINIATAERLIAEGRMQPPGLAAFERRRPDRSAVYTHEQGDIALPPAYEARLAADRRASAFWDAATASYRKICVNWVISAKQESTRGKRFTQLVDDCANGRLIPSQRYGTPPSWLPRAAAAASAASATSNPPRSAP
jgi:uncharacterized protein YdeI (YjbR/CyaY-like superfamily)